MKSYCYISFFWSRRGKFIENILFSTSYILRKQIISFKMYLIYLHFKVTVDGCKIGCLSKKIFLHALLKKIGNMEACSGQNSRDKNDPEDSISN